MGLQDIDNPDSYEKLYAELGCPRSKNFVVTFDTTAASCTRNVSTDEVSSIITSQHKEGHRKSCLWLNLWGWDEQHEEMVTVIGKHYGLSPRLTHVLCPRPVRTGPMQPQQQGKAKIPVVEEESLLGTSSVSMVSDEIPLQATHSKPRMPTSIADIASDLWHFCTVDYGQRYLCICWNALFFLPGESMPYSSGKPTAIRIWSSVLLCDDGTVVSTFESPSYLSPRAKVVIRHSQLNILTHLSTHDGLRGSGNALMQINIRPFSTHTSPDSAVDSSSMASALFYYLFDDWINIYHQAVGGPHSYRSQLESLRRSMIDSAKVEQVTKLHRLGRELSVLRAVYQSYQSIIERIVQKHRRLRTSDSANGLTSCQHRSPDCSAVHSINEFFSTNVKLTANDVSRFERLLDRIALCAITEVDECIKEKDDLVMMNFNLISLKESQAVEKLTRITVLLAKVTILFLPVSLTTAYFSMQFNQINDLYSLKTYWLSFMVVGVLTLMFLGVFGWLSDRYNGKIVFKGLTKTWLGRRKKGRGNWDA